MQALHKKAMEEITDRLQLVDKEIDIVNSKTLFNKPITPANLETEWETHNCRWTVEDGWLTGKNPNESAGMALLREDFHGDILLEFEGRTLSPSSHDIDFMWNGEWDDKTNSCGVAYIGGIGGWWDNRIGIEKSPGYTLRATTAWHGIQPGITYKIQAGSINGHCFIFINGKEIIELVDPNPIDPFKYCKIAFTAWSSHIQIKNIIVRQIAWKAVKRCYKLEF